MRFPSRLLLTILPFLVASLSPALAQMSSSDVAMRLDALENQIRQLTGQVEQLQFRNQQLEQQLKRTTEDYEFRFQELGGKGAPRAAQPQRAPAPQVAQPQPPRVEPGISARCKNSRPRCTASARAFLTK